MISISNTIITAKLLCNYLYDIFMCLFFSYGQYHGYVSTAVSIFGLIANSANIVVLTRKNMINPTNTILLWLAVADLLTMVSYLPFAIYFFILRDPNMREYLLSLCFYPKYIIIIINLVLALTFQGRQPFGRLVDHDRCLICHLLTTFLSHKINFVTLCYRPFYQKKKFFLRNQEIFSFFMCFGPRRSFYEKSSGVRRPASCGQNFNVEKFRFQIISKPFDRSTSYLV